MSLCLADPGALAIHKYPYPIRTYPATYLTLQKAFAAGSVRPSARAVHNSRDRCLLAGAVALPSKFPVSPRQEYIIPVRRST